MSKGEKKFKMRFDPNTIRHLGIKMYAQIPGALAELIANAYDADATEIKIKLYDKISKGGMRIVVEDDGMGMTAAEINEKFLVIGRNRREDEAENITPKKRVPSGKKGLGKLALFGIGNKIKVETQSAGKRAIAFVMDWRRIQSQKKTEYNPKRTEPGAIKDGHGTVVTISELARKTPFGRDYQKYLVERIARLFNYRSDDVEISISVNDDAPVLVTKSVFFDGLKIELDKTNFPPILYDGKRRKITGRIVTDENPLSADVQGVALYANGRMVNRPEFFGESVSGYFYSYTTGYLVVDFVDEGHGENDLISTNRQSLDWENPSLKKLRGKLRKFIWEIDREWRNIRREKAKKKAEEASGKHAAFGDLRPRIQRGMMKLAKETHGADTKNLIENLINYVGPKRSHKRIMISHARDDKKLADVIYCGLTARGVKPEHILYTSSQNQESRLPVRKDIYEYIRDFFMQDWFYNPHVIFVVSESMEKSWNAVLEAGAAWVTRTEHTLAVAHGKEPKRPLNRENFLYIAFDKAGNYQDDVDAHRVLDSIVKRYREKKKPKKAG